MLIKTKQFGEIEIDMNQIIKFPNGILGFESLKRYTLFTLEEEPKIKCLQCIDDENVAFYTIIPWDFFSDYEINISDEELDVIHANSVEQLIILNTLTIYDDIRYTTSNLLAPIVINADTLEGVQIVLKEDNYSTRHYIFSGQRGEA